MKRRIIFHRGIVPVILSIGICLTGCSGSGEETASEVIISQENSGSVISSAESTDDASLAGDVDVQETEIQNSNSLSLSSMYTSDLDNPDCGNVYAEGIPTIEVTNSSEQYLLSAEFSAEMSDGSTRIFRAADLPAGATVEIFESENHILEGDVSCLDIVSISEEYMDMPGLPEGIIIEPAGQTSIITNTRQETVQNLTVVYRCSMGEQFLGGVSYEVKVDSLAPGESYIVEDGTLLGEIAVVRVYE